MDRLLRRQIGSRSFLRPERVSIQNIFDSDYIRNRTYQRGRCHEFDVGDIHGPATRNLFLLIRWNGPVSIFDVISRICRRWSLFERGSNREGTR